ncbi:IclR family transcriptional regulator [Treponema sp. OMZ 840]|uniref:IclR family transcriptional regulator n=1 Tax=Treponema sp. OMZ 840 TaxID=244313 RepID=UPI003D923B10
MEKTVPMHNPTLRVVAVLNLISACKSGCTLAECSRALRIPSGTLYPILQTLYKKAYLNYDEYSYRYTAGSRLFLAGINYVSDSSPYESVQKILEKIVYECGETAHWGLLEGVNVLYFAKADSPETVRMYSAVGKTLPAYATALGKALLSRCSLKELKALYPKGLQALTDSTLSNIETLYEQLQSVKKDGFAYEWEESNKHICCIGIPVLADDTVVSALSVAVPVFRYNDEKENRIKGCLVRAAEEAAKIIPYLNL